MLGRKTARAIGWLSAGWTGLILIIGPVRAAPPAYDEFGGWTGRRGRPTGYFHTEKIGGKWWFVTPRGGLFFSKGVCAVSFIGDSIRMTPSRPYRDRVLRKYGSEKAWAAATAKRLRRWGLNTTGAWSSYKMWTARLAYAPILNLAAAGVQDLWLKGGIFDVYSPRFRSTLEQTARGLCSPHRRDPWLLGYFTDNELRWGPDWRSRESLLASYLRLPPGSPGRRRASAFRKQHGRPGAPLSGAEEAAFQEQVAREYFRLCRAAIRRYDPHHLILGCRFAGAAPRPVLRGMSQSVDVISLNDYSHQAPVSLCRTITAVTGRPVMITEFSFRAMDSGLPNTRGAGQPVATQRDRADLFESYVHDMAALPNCIGYHWFEWCDEPKQGRFDGENSNYGLVKIDDTPWNRLVARVRQVNQGLEQRRARLPSDFSHTAFATPLGARPGPEGGREQHRQRADPPVRRPRALRPGVGFGVKPAPCQPRHHRHGDGEIVGIPAHLPCSSPRAGRRGFQRPGKLSCHFSDIARGVPKREGAKLTDERALVGSAEQAAPSCRGDALARREWGAPRQNSAAPARYGCSPCRPA